MAEREHTLTPTGKIWRPLIDCASRSCNLEHNISRNCAKKFQNRGDSWMLLDGSEDEWCSEVENEFEAGAQTESEPSDIEDIFCWDT